MEFSDLTPGQMVLVGIVVFILLMSFKNGRGGGGNGGSSGGGSTGGSVGGSAGGSTGGGV